MSDIERVTRIRVATIKHQLEVPIHYGRWIMRHREFALLRIDSESGLSGFAYCLTRDGPLQTIVDRTVAPVYVGEPVAEPERTFYSALWTNHAVHAAGIGMRALSLVDIAAWDLAAKLAGLPIEEYLGGQPQRMPVTAIVGYPPSLSPEDTAGQVRTLWERGWRRFKVPIAPTVDASVARLVAARDAAPDGWIGFDANMVFRSAAEVLAFERQVRHLGLGWIEDLIPPGDAGTVARIREASETPVAMGDEQGGSYHPAALLAAGAVDVVRIDATTNGGITRLRPIMTEITEHGVAFSPHMFPHVHSRVLAALGYTDAPIEWGVPGTGVHPMDDGLVQPAVHDGLMEPLPPEPGLGSLVDLDWISRQDVHDPDGLLADL